MGGNDFGNHFPFSLAAPNDKISKMLSNCDVDMDHGLNTHN